MLNIELMLTETRTRIQELEQEYNSAINQIENIKQRVGAMKMDSARLQSRLVTLMEVRHALAPVVPESEDPVIDPEFVDPS